VPARRFGLPTNDVKFSTTKGAIMPIHDFRCRRCQKEFEALVRGTTPPVCPECGATEHEKRVSAPSAGGWSKDAVSRARAQASAAGHFSHYRKGERPR
jgi:putative FmdB family regulatory protein